MIEGQEPSKGGVRKGERGGLLLKLMLREISANHNRLMNKPAFERKPEY